MMTTTYSNGDYLLFANYVAKGGPIAPSGRDAGSQPNP